MNKNSNIGFIGLGNMGKPIFDHVNKKFSNIFCFDKDVSKLKKNKFSSSLDEIFEKCEIIIFCIESNEQIIDIIKENTIKKNTIVIDLTSSLPELTMRISSYLKEFEAYYVDAGMSGGASGATNGTLTLMLGGRKTICKKINFILKTFAKNIFYLGKSGNGHMMKLLHNSVCHSIFLLNCEILNIAKSYNIKDRDMIEIFNKSNARSYISEKRFPDNIFTGEYNGRSSIKNLKKDLKMINTILENTVLKTDYTRLSKKILNRIDDKYNYKDFTYIYKIWDKL